MPDYPQIQALAVKDEENFPVGSRLLPEAGREIILQAYRFARYADDIADSPTYTPAQKTQWLTNLYDALKTQEYKPLPAALHPFYQNVAKHRIPRILPEKLLLAFMQDVAKNRYANWEELIHYCSLSAEPVGRLVLGACKEHGANMKAADALCAALQLLNHAQDLKSDYTKLDRIYLPQDWMAFHSASDEMLAEPTITPAVRAVLDDLLTQCETLLVRAHPLPASVEDARLRWELAFTLELAYQLLARLRRQDPIATRVAVPKWQWPLWLVVSLRRTV